MSRTDRYESDPRTVVLGMSQILVNVSSHMSRLWTKGALERNRRKGRKGRQKKIIVHSPVCHMIMTVFNIQGFVWVLPIDHTAQGWAQVKRNWICKVWTTVVTQEVQSKVHTVTCLWACSYILVHHRGVSPSQTESASGIRVIHAEESTGWDSESLWIESRRKKGKCDTGYVFHNSHGIKSGSTKELETEGIHSSQVCRETLTKEIACNMVCAAPIPLIKTADSLGGPFGVRYCIPMDGHQPGLNLRFH